jgi:hypothetical protein
MKLAIVCVAFLLTSCAKKDATETVSEAAGSPSHVVVHLNDGSKIPGAIIASSPTEMVLMGDDNIERKIPVTQVKSVDYAKTVAKINTPPVSRETIPPPPPAPLVTTKTNELPVGSHVSVQMNESIDSGKASEGQTFDAQVTRDCKDADGDIVIPRGSQARVVIKSASGGGAFHGKADLVLDMQSVMIDGKVYSIGTADIAQKGRDNVGINKRTAEFTGGGAALGAIIGAIAGGGKGAAIGAGAGGGAGAVTQMATKGGSIKIPVESVLTFRLDRPLRVRADQ